MALSESRDQRSLLPPVWWKIMVQEPLGCEADRPLAIHNIPDDVWRKEGQIDHLLDTSLDTAESDRAHVRRLLEGSVSK